MKRVLIFLFLSTALYAKAQYSENFFDGVGKIKLGGGYTHDFPGLNGYTLSSEFTYTLNGRLEGGFGIKRINLQGTPRTNAVNEYTKATTLDFNLYYQPLQTETSIIRFGVGYSFSFYKIRRSFPVIETHGSNSTTSWPVHDKKSRISGMSVTGEYEYLFPESNFSLGLRASLFKAYDGVSYIGPFVGIRL